MKFSKWSLIAVIVVALSAVLGLGLIAAADSQPEPGTPRDNACYEGGVMAGKCTLDWHWEGGWYLARFLSGDLTRQQVPDDFQILLPPPPPPVVDGVASPVTTICKAYGWESNGQVCLSSNQTGSMDWDGNGTDTYYIFTNDAAGADCPSTFNDMLFGGKAYETSGLVNYLGFSQAELDQLGLKTYYCMYHLG